MKFADPIAVAMRKVNNTVIIAGGQAMGDRPIQEDFFSNFNDECVVVADGVSGLPNGDVAARLASETAIWGYKHIRQRPFYWADKELLLKRIFRSVNLTIWQKRREKGFEMGLATTLSVLIIGGYKFWVGTVGDSSVLLYRESLIDFLTPVDVREDGTLTNALGMKRLGLVPHVAVEKFLPRDIILMATDGVLNYLDEDQLRVTFEVTGDTKESVANAVSHLIHTAQENGSRDNMTAILLKRIRAAEE